MSKQTALDWYIEQEQILGNKLVDDTLDLDQFNNEVAKLKTQAKQMEKKQMDNVSVDWWNEGASYMYDGKRKYDSFEQYYNETYKDKI